MSSPDPSVFAELCTIAGISEFDRVSQIDPTVYQMRRRGASLEEIIVALVKHKDEMLQRLVALDSIAPRKIRSPDGTVMIWHCPDDLVPETPRP